MKKSRHILKKALAVTVCVSIVFGANINTFGAEKGSSDTISSGQKTSDTFAVQSDCAATAASDSLDDQIAAAEAELCAAQSEYDAIMEQYNRGSLGFIEWMRAKDGLTDAQVKDLDNAKKIIEDACEEDFKIWANGENNGLPSYRNDMVTCLGDLMDATSLVNTKKMFSMLREVNDKRQNDENYVGAVKRNPGKTNFFFMAVAQTGADRGAGLKDHSRLSVSCENLAFTLPKAAVGMWYREIGAFNRAKEALGYTVLSSEEQISEIEDYAGASNVGHYTNLMYAADQYMGIGYTGYGYTVNNGTACYNAGSYAAYKSYAAYTIDEFEALFNEYYATVSCDSARTRQNEARKKLESLVAQKQSSCTHTFVMGESTSLSCTTAEGVWYTCSKCGEEKCEEASPALGHDMVDGVCSRCGVTGPISLDDIRWRTGEDSVTNMSSLTFEEGYDSEIAIRTSTASKSVYDDEFEVEIEDSDVCYYIATSNVTGYMHMVKPGETTVTIYSRLNPELKSVFKLSVTDVGGHDYVYEQAEPGSGITTRTCSKCGMTKTVSIPSAISRVTWYKGSSGYSVVPYMEVGEACDMKVYFTPYSVSNSDFIITSSDEKVATVGSMKYISGGISIPITSVGIGETVIRVQVKYDPSVYREFTLDIEDVGGHEFEIESPAEGLNRTTKKCTKCGQVRDVALPTEITRVRWKKGTYYVDMPEICEEGTEVRIEIYGDTSGDYLKEFGVVSADSSIIQVVETDNNTAKLLMKAAGETTITVCGKYNPWVKREYTVEVTEQGGHSYTLKTVSDETLMSPASCDSPAYYHYTCEKCGRIDRRNTCGYFSVGEKLGHLYKPTYVWNDELTSCTLNLVCERERGHAASYSMNIYDDKKYPTCEDDGAEIKMAYLVKNNTAYSDTKVVKVLEKKGHNWDPFTVVKAPDCTTGGIETFRCITCGAEEDMAVPALGHNTQPVIRNDKSSTCKEQGYTGDKVCPDCGDVIEKGELLPLADHSFADKIVADDYLKAPATESSPAEYFYACSYCGAKGEKTYFYGDRIRTDISGGTVTLDKTTYVYDKTAKKPKVTVTYEGQELIFGTDYTVSYTGNVNVGTAGVTVTGTGDYKGTLTASFRINKAAGKINLTSKYVNKYAAATNRSLAVYTLVSTNCGTPLYTSSNSSLPVSKSGRVTVPAKYIGYTYITIKTNNPNYTSVSARILVKIKAVPTSITAVSSPYKNAVKLTWKKVALCDGYQVQYSQYKTFPVGKYRLGTVKGNTKSGAAIKGADKLKSGKVYYVRVRTYKYQSGSAKKSDWSKTIAVRVK